MKNNILGLDYGKKYIGLSIGNILTLSCSPYLFIKNNFINFLFFDNLILKLNPILIVIGFPNFNKKNIKSYINIIFLLKKFILKVINKYCIRIKLINEEFSSKNFLFIKKNIRKNIRKDHFSAFYILSKYLYFIYLWRMKVVGFEPTISQRYI